MADIKETEVDLYRDTPVRYLGTSPAKLQQSHPKDNFVITESHVAWHLQKGNRSHAPKTTCFCLHSFFTGILTYIGLMGYANEVGESFRALIHVNWVRLSYGVASAYVLADTFDKSSKMSKGKFDSSNAKTQQVTIAAADTLLWQAFASVIIPGFTINRLCAASLYTLKKTTKLPKVARKWITTGIGLASIPLIIHPIDRFVDFAMDNTFREVFNMKRVM